MPVVDLSNVKGLEPIPEGWYQAEVERAEERTSKKGNPKITLGWKVLSGPFEGRMVWQDLVFEEKAMIFTKDYLVGMGYDPEYTGDVEAEDLVGTVCAIRVAIEQSEGINESTGKPYEPQNRVNKVKASSVDAEDLLS